MYNKFNNLRITNIKKKQIKIKTKYDVNIVTNIFKMKPKIKNNDNILINTNISIYTKNN